VAAFERLEKALGLPVIESYGITEAASQVTSNPLPPAKRKPGSVGRPYGLELAVFKDGQKFGPGDFPPLVAGPGAIGAELTGPGVTGSGEVGFGPIGEVGIRGESVFKGYWQDPEATRAAFRDGWFMTGDMGQLDAEGYLFLKGRAKELINRAGEMISPLEIDEALYQVRGVESAASVGVPHPLYGEEIVAFVNVAPGHEVTSTDLAEICRERLSPHKIPKRFYFGLELPKGPSGKIQRLKLVETYLELAKQGLGLDV
jgi:acyl-CoA synthetase (AMP-forming)/AMP-acid ligase II